MPSYTDQLDDIEATIDQYDDLLDDIEGDEYVRENISYRRDGDDIEVVIDPDQTIETGDFDSLVEHAYAPPHSKRYRVEKDDDQYRINDIFGNGFELWLEDDQAHLRFDAGDEDWAFEEGKRIGRALEE